jgi:hypothetical protein
MPPQRQSTKLAPKKGTLTKLETLSDQLDTAKDASEDTTKELQHARRTAESVTRDVRRQQPADHSARTRKRSRERYTARKSKAAVELGRKGGTARAKTLTRQQRSALAKKAAKTRWKRA